MVLVETQDFVKPFQLQTGMRQVARIGISKVGENPFDFYMPALQRRRLKKVRAVIVNADPLHARVDLQMDFCFDVYLRCDRVDLLQTFYRRSGQRQVVLQIAQDLVSPDAAQNNDRSRNAKLAQQDSFFQDRHADIVGLSGQGLRHFY